MLLCQIACCVICTLSHFRLNCLSVCLSLVFFFVFSSCAALCSSFLLLLVVHLCSYVFFCVPFSSFLSPLFTHVFLSVRVRSLVLLSVFLSSSSVFARIFHVSFFSVFSFRAFRTLPVCSAAQSLHEPLVVVYILTFMNHEPFCGRVLGTLGVKTKSKQHCLKFAGSGWRVVRSGPKVR